MIRNLRADEIDVRVGNFQKIKQVLQFYYIKMQDVLWIY